MDGKFFRSAQRIVVVCEEMFACLTPDLMWRRNLQFFEASFFKVTFSLSLPKRTRKKNIQPSFFSLCVIWMLVFRGIWKGFWRLKPWCVAEDGTNAGNAPSDAPAIALDCEGIRLGRFGRICRMAGWTKNRLENLRGAHPEQIAALIRGPLEPPADPSHRIQVYLSIHSPSRINHSCI